MCKIELNDAYLLILITQKYFKLAWQGTVYQYNILPFRMSTTPEALMKLMY